MSKVICISQEPSAIRKICQGYQLVVVEWPETGVYGESVKNLLESQCPKNLDAIDLVICENLLSSPVLFHLRKSGYKGPIILIPHINPYPVMEFLHTLLCASIWGSNDIIITGSTHSAKIYRHFFRMKSVITGTYGIDTSLFSPKDKDYSRKKLDLPSENKLLLYTGRFYPDRNLGMLLTAFSFLQKIMPNLRLIMSIKYKDNSYYNMLSEKLKDIIVFEKLPPSKMPYLYSAADLFVSCSTSYFETFGRSPLESIACGTPVVVPDWFGYKDYITDQTGILVPVDYIDEPLYDDMSYHMVDPLKFVDSCIKALSSPKKLIDSVPLQTTSSFAVSIIRRMVYEMTRDKKSYHQMMDNSLTADHPIIEEVYRKLNIQSIDELFYFLTQDSEKVRIFEKSLKGYIYNNLFTTVIGIK